MTLHGHPDHYRCTLQCPVGPVQIHFDTDCNHTGRDVCRECAGFTDEEVAALREHFVLLAARPVPIDQKPEWADRPCAFGCDCGDCYSRSPDDESLHHCAPAAAREALRKPEA